MNKPPPTTSNQAGERTQKYTTNGMRALRAETMREAAQMFAERHARKEFGKRGYARTCTQNSYAQNGSLAEYNAFIGYRTGQHETTGHNVMFTVYHD